MRLIEVDWDPESRWYNVRARADESQSWSHFDGPEEDVNTLLSIARDTMTGGWLPGCAV